MNNQKVENRNYYRFILCFLISSAYQFFLSLRTFCYGINKLISPDEEVNSKLYYGNDFHHLFHLPISCSKYL
jgi:hypothetical protein